MSAYQRFIDSKRVAAPAGGLEDIPPLNPRLFPFQADCVAWALRRGRAALFEDCGLGKSGQALEWSRVVCEATGGNVLILTPLAVAAQMRAEGEKFGISARVSRDGSVEPGITITNYELLHRFDPTAFIGVVLDESSVLKAFSGKLKQALMRAFKDTRFKLACTATPAPNDHLELGNHAEFLGIMTSHEMIARWFLPDTSTFGTYRLKGHAVRPFWDWVATWARCVGRPSDLGYSDDGFDLPPMRVHRHPVAVDLLANRGDALFRQPDLSATAIHQEKRLTARDRARKVADLVAHEPNEPWIVWCDTDYDAAALTTEMPEAVEVAGRDRIEVKEAALQGFVDGSVRVLITKPKIAGFGLNLQRCARMAFAGPTYSYEQWYQATRRCWRFGQRRPVDVHVAMAHTELDVWAVQMQKAAEHEAMRASMFHAMRRAQINEDTGARAYAPRHRAALPKWMLP